FCFILGGCFCYFIIYSFILEFLELFTPAAVETQWTLSNYIAITTRFMLAFGIIFEEPVVITLLAKIGIVTAAGLGKFRPYAIVIMFSLSALITPPDPFSQSACALPLYILYEISIVIVRIIERRKEESGESYAG
ncbi:MAG: twin-arginine translocase subunit TatC, partial [Candidatus Hinthialibacter sp.]